MKTIVKKWIEKNIQTPIKELKEWEISAYTEAALIDALGFTVTPAEIEKKLLNAQETHITREKARARYTPYAEKAIQKYRLDPARVDRAVEIVIRKNIRYINGIAEITASDEKEFYSVTLKSCTCPDSTVNKQICKHRIALWMYEQATPAPTYEDNFYMAYIHCMDCNRQHYIKIDGQKEICLGYQFNPAHIPTHYTKAGPRYKGAVGVWVVAKMPASDQYQDARKELITMHSNAEV